MTSDEIFELNYKSPHEYRQFIPYRICTLGAHIDHQQGCINGFAIDKGMYLYYSPSHSQSVTVVSSNYNEKCSFTVNEALTKNGEWVDYAKSALWSLKDSGCSITEGFDGVIEGTMPVGGLSSSAGVTILYINAFCKVNGIELSEAQLIDIAHKAENRFIGLKCGRLDQSCEILCKKDNLLFLDTQDNTYKNIKVPDNMKSFEIAVFYSGLEHALVNSDYNLRTQELKSACLTLKEKAGIKTKNDVLREISEEIFEQYKNCLPENEVKRCLHFYSENKRTLMGAEVFSKGDITQYGNLITQSGYSSVYNYEAGSPELTYLYNIISETDGVYGGRFSGAGFKGCCFALIDPDHKEAIYESVKNKYSEKFPEHKEKYMCVFCSTADGFGGTK